MTLTRINVLNVINTKGVRKEKRNGRDVLVVPSATLPDNVIMNGIEYPAEEIEKSFKGLERTPAPLGHPIVNGKYVSASDPEAINGHYIGAWNENVRRENGRVLLDKVIDVVTAKSSDGGIKVLNAIEKGEPIHTSTGLVAKIETIVNDGKSKKIATNMIFDHDAILLNEVAAATPEKGVGMLVNSESGQPEEVEVINSAYNEADRDATCAASSLVTALEKRDKSNVIERVKEMVASMLGASQTVTNTKDDDEMSLTKEEAEKLKSDVEGIKKTVESLGEMVTNSVKAAFDAKDEADKKAKAEADKAEKTAVVNKLVEAQVMTAEDAEHIPLTVLNNMAEKLSKADKKPVAMNLINKQSGEKQEGGFKLPKAS